MKLDYSLTSPEERVALVEKILEETPNPSEAYLETLANYLIMCMEKQEKKERKILTDNRMVTVKGHEISYEGLVSQLENGEDGIYNMISENKKNELFKPKVGITQKDLDEIPLLKQLRDTIHFWEEKLKVTEGKDAYTIKKMLIEMRKDSFIIKNAYRVPVGIKKTMTGGAPGIPLNDETCELDAEKQPIVKGFSLMNPKIVSELLCRYSKLRQDSYERLDNDLKWVIEDLDTLTDKALADYPVYMFIVEKKIDGWQNQEIKFGIQENFGIVHTVEYISTLWRNKIPNLIADKAQEEFLDYWYLEVEKGKYKKCSKCGQIKLANKRYFSKNASSKDGFYSICKACRNKKKDKGGK